MKRNIDVDIDDLYFEEDYIESVECYSCHESFEDEEMFEESQCPCCGGELVNNTQHEGFSCEICGTEFCCWEDWYTDGFIKVCEDCYNQLESEE